MFPHALESDRLDFEGLSRETVDVLALYDVFGRGPDVEAVFEYVDSDPHRTPKETYEFVRRAETQWDDGEGAKYVIRPKAGEEGTGEIAGVTGIYPDWERRLATLGIVLDKRFWGRGYSGERADLFVRLAFERFDLDLVAVTYIDENERSKRAIERYVERFGGRYEGLLRNWLAVDGEVFDCHRYSIHRDEYEHARSNASVDPDRTGQYSSSRMSETVTTSTSVSSM